MIEFGSVTEWMQVSELGEDQILLRSFNRFERSQETLEEELKLTFRGNELLTAQLANAGFETFAVSGDWHETPFDGSQPVMVFQARAI